MIVGHWSDPEVQDRLAAWMRAASAWHDLQGARFARFGDNMRQVAVTEGDKVAAEARFGFAVDGFGVGDLVGCINEISDADSLAALCGVRREIHRRSRTSQGRGAARIAARWGADRTGPAVLSCNRAEFRGFTTTFEDLHGLKQLPGLAVQRLMNDGYGFGAEGDWKTAALLRAVKVMAAGLPGGTSFMEDYTYHLNPGGYLVLGAHMLEVCESIAAKKPTLEIHPLGIGGKADPVRLVFDCAYWRGNQRVADRSGQSLSHGGQRSGRRGSTASAAQAAGGARGLVVPAGFQDRVRGLDLRRRGAPYGLQPGDRDRASPRFRRDRQRRDRARDRNARYHLGLGLARVISAKSLAGFRNARAQRL